MKKIAFRRIELERIRAGFAAKDNPSST